MRADVESGAGGYRLPAHEVRNERLKLIEAMLQLLVGDAATMPTAQQVRLREAAKAVQQVQAWCRTHAPGL